jgi:Arc-like DNA binding domain
MARKPTQIVQLKLRIQEKLRREVEQRAKKSRRSLNSELVAMLETAIRIKDFDGFFAALEDTHKALRNLVDDAAQMNAAATPEENAQLDAIRGTIRRRLPKEEESK